MRGHSIVFGVLRDSHGQELTPQTTELVGGGGGGRCGG